MATPYDNSNRPIYAVGSDGQWVTDASGARAAFTGTAQLSALYQDAYLCDADGNLLYYDGDDIPVPAADLAAVNARAARDPSFIQPAPAPSPEQDFGTPTTTKDSSRVPSAVATPTAGPAQAVPVAATPSTGYAAPAAVYAPASARAGEHPAPQPAAAPSVPPEAQADGGRKDVIVWVALLLAVLLISLFALGASWYVTGARANDAADSASPAASAGSASPAAPSASGDPAPQSTESGTDAPASPAPEEKEEEEETGVPAEAYPGAGEAQIPSDAWLTGESDGSFDWMAPSENIRCRTDGQSDEMRCMIASWQEDAPEGNAPGTDRPADTVVLGVDGEPRLEADGGSIGHVDATLLYDTTIYDANRNWVCGAKENGITCWSLKSGHGFLIRRAGMETF